MPLIQMSDEQYKRYQDAEEAHRLATMTNAARAEYKKKQKIKRQREQSGLDWSPVEGSDGRLYPAHIYKDAYGNDMSSLTGFLRRDRELNFLKVHGEDWQLD